MKILKLLGTSPPWTPLGDFRPSDPLTNPFPLYSQPLWAGDATGGVASYEALGLRAPLTTRGIIFLRIGRGVSRWSGDSPETEITVCRSWALSIDMWCCPLGNCFIRLHCCYYYCYCNHHHHHHHHHHHQALFHTITDNTEERKLARNWNLHRKKTHKTETTKITALSKTLH